MKHTEEEKLAAFGQVLDVMDKLRAGCPNSISSMSAGGSAKR